MRERGSETLVILPTYEERTSLPTIVSALREQLPDADLLVIDDGSPDGTGEVADELASQDSRVSVLHREGKLGLGTAYVTGFKHALAGEYRFVVEMDSDGSHLADELPPLITAARAGAGLVLGARWVPGGKIENWPWYRQAISRAGTIIARFALRSKLHDLTSGFRVIDTNWLRRLDLSAMTTEGYGFQVELAWGLERIGCPVVEVPITFVERSSGRSKMSFGIVTEALARVLLWGWQLRFDKLRR